MANEIVSQLILDLDLFRAQLKAAEKEGAASGNATAKGLGDGVEKGLTKIAGGIKAFAVTAATTFVAGFAVGKLIEKAS
jgi:hypothetical protein